MCRFFLLFIAVHFILVALPVRLAGSDKISTASFFTLPASRQLLEVFLQFHDKELCRGIEAVFVSNENSIEIWCRVEDEGRYKKFLKMLELLPESERVEIYKTVPALEENSEEDDGLPASLWENEKLRKLLWIPLIRSTFSDNSEIPVLVMSPEEIYKQRLRLYAKQILNKSKEMERYAAELPTLTCIARDPAVDADLNMKANKICRNHADKLGKLIGKLEKDLKQAITEEDGIAELDVQGSSSIAATSLPELAAQISESSRTVSRRIYSFIYPDRFTIELDELRNPPLLNSLRILLNMAEEYSKRMEWTER